MIDLHNGDVFEFKDGSFGRIVLFNFQKMQYKVRKIRPCVGDKSSADRIGMPYTYQLFISKRHLIRARKIGTEELLMMLFNKENTK